MKSRLLEEGFTLDQIAEIEAGIRQGIDVSLYADKRYLAIQMRQIRYGLETGIDVRAYADPKYDWFQMEEIRKGLLAGLPIERYASPSISYDNMKQIRLGLCSDIDLSPFKHLESGILKQLRLALMSKVKIVPYISEGYDMEQLEAIREALENKIPIEPYISIQYRGVAIREICIGLEHGVDVTYYANPRYCWQQMREIRIGLEHRIDVTKYMCRYYSHEQMREIRIGLEAGLDISYFSSLMYTAADMKNRRLALLEHPTIAICDESDNMSTADEKLPIRITFDEEKTKAYAEVRELSQGTFRVEMLKALREKDISIGVRYDTIDRLLQGKESRSHALIASGTMPVDGADGYYEYFFRTHVPRTPKQTEDGIVDYRNVDWFELVKKGQKLAVYHGASEGIKGMTVTGKEIPARKGKEQCILTGKGFHRLEDEITYVADLDGIVNYSEKVNESNEIVEIRIDVTELLIAESVTLATGDVHFDGNVFIQGNVGSGAGVYATGDVLIGGFVESSKINSGGSIMIRQGMNASGDGEIRAAGDVQGLFFEAVKIDAGGTIRADYFMNCELSAQDRIYADGKNGSLVGGVAHAESGIKVRQLGNQIGLATYVKLGKSERLRKEEQELNDSIKNVKSELETLMRAHDDFVRRFPSQIRNTSNLYIKVGNAIYTKEKELNDLLKAKQELEIKKRNNSCVSAVIENKLYENVTFEIDGVQWKTTNTLVSVQVEKEKDKIALLAIRDK